VAAFGITTGALDGKETARSRRSRRRRPMARWARADGGQ